MVQLRSIKFPDYSNYTCESDAHQEFIINFAAPIVFSFNSMDNTMLCVCFSLEENTLKENIVISFNSNNNTNVLWRFLSK